MIINRVVQKDTQGCGIACLAMVTEQDYDAVKSGFEWDRWNSGLIDMAISAYLAEHGYAVAIKYPHYMPLERKRDTFPPKPFADVHLVSADGHVMVMLRDGTIIDPAPSRPETRTINQYSFVYWVMAVVKIP